MIFEKYFQWKLKANLLEWLGTFWRFRQKF